MSTDAGKRLESLMKGPLDPAALAAELNSVQPMDGKVFEDLMAGGTSEEELRAQGFEPVSDLGLMWVKKKNV